MMEKRKNKRNANKTQSLQSIDINIRSVFAIDVIVVFSRPCCLLTTNYIPCLNTYYLVVLWLVCVCVFLFEVIHFACKMFILSDKNDSQVRVRVFCDVLHCHNFSRLVSIADSFGAFVDNRHINPFRFCLTLKSSLSSDSKIILPIILQNIFYSIPAFITRVGDQMASCQYSKRKKMPKSKIRTHKFGYDELGTTKIRKQKSHQQRRRSAAGWIFVSVGFYLGFGIFFPNIDVPAIKLTSFQQVCYCSESQFYTFHTKKTEGEYIGIYTVTIHLVFVWSFWQ